LQQQRLDTVGKRAGVQRNAGETTKSFLKTLHLENEEWERTAQIIDNAQFSNTPINESDRVFVDTFLRSEQRKHSAQSKHRLKQPATTKVDR
jgi:hypothetical protein